MLILIMPAGFLNRKYFKDLFEKGLVRFFWSKETAAAVCNSSNALGLKFLSSIDVECTEIIEFGRELQIFTTILTDAPTAPTIYGLHLATVSLHEYIKFE
jgi:hypothetical protein